MANRKTSTLLALMLVLLAGVALMACAPAPAVEEPAAEEPAAEEPAAEEPATEEPAAEEPVKVLFMTEDPIGVNPYFITGIDGLEKAEQDFNIETQIVEGTGDPAQNDENLRAAVREDWDLFILMTFGFEDTLNEIAPEYPDKVFVCIDCGVEADNVRNIDFRTQEAAFLLGTAAGMMTEANIVGQIGPVEMPFMHRWTDPFAEGAKYVNPDVEVLDTLWVGDWADPATAKELALTLAGQGADHINGVAAAGNPGVFEAAEEENFLTYGVDINECPKAPGYIVDSVIKRVDTAVYNSIQDFLNSEEMGGFVAYGLAEEGVDLAVFAFPDEDTQCVLAEYPDVMDQVAEYRQMIVDGEIVIPDPIVGGDYVLP
jgi:basic membrane protein A